MLRNPDDMKTSTWEKFINDISSDVTTILETNNDVTHAVVKQIIHALYFRVRLLNYEIGYIQAGLSDNAERTLSSLVFAYAFKYLYEKKYITEQQRKAKIYAKKEKLFQFFFQKIENHKRTSRKWNKDAMAESDENLSRAFALHYSNSVKREIVTIEQRNMRKYIEDKKELFSYDSIVSLVFELIVNELSKNPDFEVSDINNFVVQYICDRNRVFRELFLEKWEEEEKKLFEISSKNIKEAFNEKISGLMDVLSELSEKLIRMPEEDKSLGEHRDSEKRLMGNLNSDNIFELIELGEIDHSQVKEIQFKAMNNYLKMYLDPTVTSEEFKHYFSGIFKIYGFDVKVYENIILCCKPNEPILNVDTFRQLVSTNMFHDSELIFNIHGYVKHFQSVLEEYQENCFELKSEFLEIIVPLKSEFETKMIGCSSQCPSCGKFCEREIHAKEEQCQIKTGHKIASMGGRVWNKDKNKTAVLSMCDAYKKDTKIILPHSTMKWNHFQDQCKEWNWILPNDDKYRSKQLSNKKIMKDIWNKFGRAILMYYYEKEGIRITFVPYTNYEKVNKSLSSSICLNYKI